MSSREDFLSLNRCQYLFTRFLPLPKRTDIKKILLIGSGPIVIGQGAEFDYSGTQACRALREEGYQVVLVNNNPATIMTDPDVADATYIEPITVQVLEKIIAKERPEALLPTMGGQTALNMAIRLVEEGILARYNVILIGAQYEAIQRAEDRELFKEVVRQAGMECPKSVSVSSLEEAIVVSEVIGFPIIIRASYTLGGAGGGVAYNLDQLRTGILAGLAASPIHKVLVEESVLGWKEYELEVMRDRKDNVVIVCSIENFNPMGIHTGDSITVAPAQTLTDKEYQQMRDGAIRIIRQVGIDTGGSNIQFAFKEGQIKVIEMNPRVSRSSALASKATGFPIAKIAAKLAIGLTLDEIKNDITRVTPACFEPTLDYVVVKIPRFAFEKFPQANPTLTLQMKSVGEVMAIGRNFKEALMKAIRSLEIRHEGHDGMEWSGSSSSDPSDLIESLSHPNHQTLRQIAEAIRQKISTDEIVRLTQIDRWFIYQIAEIVQMEEMMKKEPKERGWLRVAKAMGYSDRQIAQIVGSTEQDIYQYRKKQGILPVYKRVDTCGAEFEAYTPYFYSTYEKECEAAPTDRKKVMILGSGPNRIGQGVEFDYCCVHAAQALKDIGYESIMINCNPETVSTDYDTSDRLYFEPLTQEDVLHIIERERPLGVIVQLGGQTPLKLALSLEAAGVRILGTSPDEIDRAEDRARFNQLIQEIGLTQPPGGMARSHEDALRIVSEIGYPVMVRPSYVLGGHAMEIIYNATGLSQYISKTGQAWEISSRQPVLIDRYLEDAIEIDVDAVSDGEDCLIGGIMEHIEEAGVHSGDSACSLPPFSLSETMIAEIQKQTKQLARALHVIGLINVQFAVKEETVYVLEVNPRASRTIPFVSKATGIPLAKVAMKVVLGETLKQQGCVARPMRHVAVKEAVFPFRRLHVDPILGPEMKSTGEVMGIDRDFGLAFAKAQEGADNRLPLSGVVFISVKNSDKQAMVPIAAAFLGFGFSLVATAGTATYLNQRGIQTGIVKKVKEGTPHIVDRLKKGGVDLVVNTTGTASARADSYTIREAVLSYGIPYFTTVAGARAALKGIASLLKGEVAVQSLQAYHAQGASGEK